MLLQSSKDEGHYHVLLSPDPRKNPGVMFPPEMLSVGVVDDHSHEVEYSPETASWFLLPSEGHTHQVTINDIYQDKPITKDSEEEALATFDVKLKRAMAYEKNSAKKATKAYEYIELDQWDDQTKQNLINDGRPALQFDQIGSNTDKILGYFLQDIPDVAIYPVENGDTVVSDILTTVIKNILRNSGKDEISEAVFSDTFIAGKGVFSIGMDFTRDIGGDVVVDSESYLHIIYGPHQKVDTSDCEDIFKIRMMSENQLKMEFPDKAKDVIEATADRTNGSVGRFDQHDYDTWLKTPGKQWDKPAAKSVPVARQMSDKEENRTYVVIEWFRKSYFKEYIIRGPEGIEPPVRLRSGGASQLKKAGVPMVDRISYVFEKVVISNAIELERFDTGFDFSPFSVSYGKKTRKGYNGKVHGAIDQQDEINKRSSQMTDVVNKMATYNWFFTGETFTSPEEKQDFLNNASIPGSGFEIADMANPPIKSEGVKMPVEIFQMEENAINRMDNYFGGVLDLNKQTNTGSRGLLLQQRTALMVNEVYFKHYENAFKDLCRKLIRFVQRFYPPQKILQIIRSTPADEQEQAYQNLEDNEILKIVSKMDMLYFDLAVDVTKSSPTFKEAQFELASELMKQGTGFPMDRYIDMSSFAQKQKIKDSIAAQSEAQSKSQQTTERMEVVKSLPEQVQMAVAPQILEQIGLLPQQNLPQASPEGGRELGNPQQ